MISRSYRLTESGSDACDDSDDIDTEVYSHENAHCEAADRKILTDPDLNGIRTVGVEISLSLVESHRSENDTEEAQEESARKCCCKDTCDHAALSSFRISGCGSSTAVNRLGLSCISVLRLCSCGSRCRLSSGCAAVRAESVAIFEVGSAICTNHSNSSMWQMGCQY